MLARLLPFFFSCRRPRFARFVTDDATRRDGGCGGGRQVASCRAAAAGGMPLNRKQNFQKWRSHAFDNRWPLISQWSEIPCQYVLTTLSSRHRRQLQLQKHVRSSHKRLTNLFPRQFFNFDFFRKWISSSWRLNLPGGGLPVAGSILLINSFDSVIWAPTTRFWCGSVAKINFDAIQ